MKKYDFLRAPYPSRLGDASEAAASQTAVGTMIQNGPSDIFLASVAAGVTVWAVTKLLNSFFFKANP